MVGDAIDLLLLYIIINMGREKRLNHTLSSRPLKQQKFSRVFPQKEMPFFYATNLALNFAILEFKGIGYCFGLSVLRDAVRTCIGPVH